MKLFADENVARAIVAELRARGHDVLHASEAQAGAPDTGEWPNAPPLCRSYPLCQPPALRVQAMGEPVPWLWVLEVFAKVAVAAGLFAYLLTRGGVRPIAATTVTLALLLALFCVSPTGAERLFVTTIALGTCSYAVLAIKRPWLRAGIIAGCFITFGLLRDRDAVVSFLTVMRDAVVSFLTVMTPLALWTGFMVILRGWARGSPRIKESPASSARDDV